MTHHYPKWSASTRDTPLDRTVRQLAERPYLVLYRQVGSFMVAFHPELNLESEPACQGVGFTEEAAVAALVKSRYETIHSLLRRGLPVPDPAQEATDYFAVDSNIAI